MRKANVIEHWLEIEDTMIVDIPKGAKRPEPGKPWRYYIFGWDVEVRDLKKGPKEFARRRLIEVEGRTKREVNERARKIVDQARIIDEGARRA